MACEAEAGLARVKVPLCEKAGIVTMPDGCPRMLTDLSTTPGDKAVVEKWSAAVVPEVAPLSAVEEADGGVEGVAVGGVVAPALLGVAVAESKEVADDVVVAVVVATISGKTVVDCVVGLVSIGDRAALGAAEAQLFRPLACKRCM